MAMWPVRPRAGSRGATWPARLSACGGAKGFQWDLFAGAPLARQGFQTAAVTAGFNLSWSY